MAVETLIASPEIKIEEKGIVWREIIYQNGPFKVVRVYILGHHPQHGSLNFAFGDRYRPETIKEYSCVRPIGVFRVVTVSKAPLDLT